MLLLVVATVFVPVRYEWRDSADGGAWNFTVRSKPWFKCDRWTSAWSRVDGVGFGGEQVTERIHWPILLAEQLLIVLLGGGLLTWAARRERRQRAETP